MPKLKLSIQTVSEEENTPTKAQFRKWTQAALRVDTEATIRIVDEAEGRMLNRTALNGRHYYLRTYCD